MMRFDQELKTCLEVYRQATGVGVLLLDAKGEEIASFGNPNDYCDLIHQNQEQYLRCMKVHAQLGPEAKRNGACYFYGCHGNMIHFAVALIDRGEYIGSVIAGPIMADYPSAATLDEVIRNCAVPSGCRSIFLSAMQNIQVVEPERMYYLGELLYHLVNHLLSVEDLKLINRQRDRRRQQELIGEAIQDLKGRNLGEQDELHRREILRNMQERQEQDLGEMIGEGRLDEAQDILNDILGGIYFSSGSTELIKLRINELITVLTQKMIYNGADAKRTREVSAAFQKKCAQTDDIEEISYGLSQLLPELVTLLRDQFAGELSEPVTKSLEYIHRNYRKQVTLEEAAAYSATSPTHFSRLFNADMGIGFSAYVNHLRVEKAKELLRESNMSLSEISQSIGFSNQQYFSKVFKTETGMTPGQFRNR